MEPRRVTTGVRYAEWYSVFTADGALYERMGYLTPSGARFGLARYDTVAQDLTDTLPTPSFPEGTKLGTALSALTAHGWWVGLRHTYRLSHLTFRGDTVRVIERGHEADQLSQAERDSIEEYEAQLRRRPIRGELEFETDLRPLFDQVLVDDKRNLWVVLTPAPEDEYARLDVFDSVGRYLGEVTAPHRLEPRPSPVFKNGRIYYVTRDDLDVQYVVIAQINGRQ
jgi:hypothetical protein